jgi:hypothetical protein
LTPGARRWATASLIAALIWLFFSMAPGGIWTTLPGLPFAAAALGAGWFSRRRSARLNDPPGVRRATWALGVGCFGCLWQVVYYAIWGVVLAGGLTALIRTWQGTPTP